MRVIFETTDYGRIECERRPDGLGTAYFAHDDFESEIDKEGHFFSLWRVPFKIYWPQPYMKSKDAILEVTVPRMIGFATPQ